jgi:uncharacterized membrane protein
MRISRWLIAGLVLSVVVNLLLVGFVAGRLSGFAPPPAFSPDPTAGFYRALGFLSDDRRAAIMPDVRKQMSELMPLLRKVRGDQHDVFDALTADPFDPPALDAALADLRANLSAAQVASHHSFVELAKQLTSGERQELARAMRRPHMHGRGGDSEGRQHPPPGMHPGGGGDEPPQEDRQRGSDGT